jgi:hypothetical protein
MRKDKQMAKVWENQGRQDQTTVIEDARPGNDGFYIDGIKHDKTSLTPQFQRKINYQYTAGSSTWRHPNSPVMSNYPDTGQQLALSKMTGSMGIEQSNSSHRPNYPWQGTWMDMSGECKIGTMTVVTNGTKESQIHSWRNSDHGYVAKWPHMANTTDLDQQNPSSSNSSTKEYYGGNISTYAPETVGDADYCMSWYRSSSSSAHYHYPSYRLGVHYGSFPDSQLTYTYFNFGSMGDYYTVQRLGISAIDGGTIWVGSYSGTGVAGNYTRIMKSVWTTSTTPTWTQLAYFSTNPTASGTSQGGSNMNSVDMPSNCSQVFDDPRGTANTKMFYRNYYDSYKNWHPQIITWDTSTDIFARETDVSTNELSSVHADMSTYALGSSNYKCEQFNMQTWSGATLRFICDMKLDGKSSYRDADTGFRTWVTYSVGASDPKALTYHSKVTMPSTPRSMIWLNDTHTMMGIWFNNSFGIYSWNDTTGWNSTTVLNHQVQSIGRDSLDRIWYVKASSKYGGTYTELHLLTPTLPVSITVVPENAAYTYSGTTLVSYMDVSAINASGTRIASSVKLVIEGSSMTFSDDSTSKTVTTLTTGDLQVATKVISAGFTNVSASIEI